VHQLVIKKGSALLMHGVTMKFKCALFAVRAIKPFVMLDTMKMVYHSYFHSIINYEIVFWGNSSYSNSIFILQKRIISIIMGVGIRDSCTEFFKILNILPLISQYINSLSYFSWLIIQIDFGCILRYIISVPGTILISMNRCYFWLFIKKVPFMWVLRYITVFHLK